MELTLNTPALLFPALTLIMLAYTNRFLALGSLVRNLHKQYENERDVVILSQIKTLRHRLILIRDMQVLGVLSLISCVLCMVCIFFHQMVAARIIFLCGIILLAGSLFISVYEIIISTKALNLQLRNLEDEESGKGFLKTNLFSKS